MVKAQKTNPEKPSADEIPKKSHHGKGDRPAQKKRRRQNNKNTERRNDTYQMIDGNFTHYPVAYCFHYNGYMTNNMVQRHGCPTRNCCRYKTMQEIEAMSKKKHRTYGKIIKAEVKPKNLIVEDCI